MFDMHGADVGDNGDIGLCDRSQAGHFSEVVHAQLQNSRFGIVRHIEDGHGQTDVVVVVAPRCGRYGRYAPAYRRSFPWSSFCRRCR